MSTSDQPVIRLSALSKQYSIVEGRPRPDTLRDYLSHQVRGVLRRRAPGAGARRVDALRDVSCDIRQGEAVGIIGRNGSGKSTLLRILSRITEPSAGYAEVRGRVGALLEVGSGFHPELSGRENVYLYGAILGMTRGEVDRKRDQIVAFAEVGAFLDTPLKHYSTGMFMRLAFAVAAHLDPEILLLDEVLAVGDAAFQKKCLAKMAAAAREGRTVLFVSHNMSAVAHLCHRVLWLDGGRLRRDGEAAAVVSAYLASSGAGQGTWRNPAAETGDAGVALLAVEILSPRNEPDGVIEYSEPCRCRILYAVRRPEQHLSVVAFVNDAAGTRVWVSWDSDQCNWQNAGPKAPGRYAAVLRIPARFLSPGRYYVGVEVRRAKRNSPPDEWQALASQESAVAFEIVDARLRLPPRNGVIRPILQWETRRVASGWRRPAAAARSRP